MRYLYDKSKITSATMPMKYSLGGQLKLFAIRNAEVFQKFCSKRRFVTWRALSLPIFLANICFRFLLTIARTLLSKILHCHGIRTEMGHSCSILSSYLVCMRSRNGKLHNVSHLDPQCLQCCPEFGVNPCEIYARRTSVR